MDYADRLNAAPHGARVRKGDMLLTLETEKIDRAIADLRSELEISELAIRQGRQQLQALERTTPLDLESSQRAARLAEEDRKFFFDVERPFLLEAVEFNLKMAKEWLEYEQEELHQLEKMYKADDITEETEQIVLKRARDAVDTRQVHGASDADRCTTRALKFAIPRRAEEVKGGVAAEVARVGEEQGGTAAGPAEAAAGVGQDAIAAVPDRGEAQSAAGRPGVDDGRSRPPTASSITASLRGGSPAIPPR